MRRERSHSSSLTARQQQSGSSSKFSIIPNNGQSSPSLSLPLRPSLAPPRHMIFNPSSLFSTHTVQAVAGRACQGSGPIWGADTVFSFSVCCCLLLCVCVCMCVCVCVLFVLGSISSSACDTFTASVLSRPGGCSHRTSPRNKSTVRKHLRDN